MYKYAIDNMLYKLAKGKFEILVHSGSHAAETYVLKTSMGRVTMYANENHAELMFFLQDTLHGQSRMVASMVVHKKEKWARIYYDLIHGNLFAEYIKDNKLLNTYNQILMLAKMGIMEPS